MPWGGERVFASALTSDRGNTRIAATTSPNRKLGWAATFAGQDCGPDFLLLAGRVR